MNARLNLIWDKFATPVVRLYTCEFHRSKTRPKL